MRFIHTFAGGNITATLTVNKEGRPSIEWRGKPIQAIFPEYNQWMAECVQTVADATHKSILYYTLGTAEPLLIEPRS